MQHEILFQRPVFNKGLNVTVRNGDKWMKAEIGDTLLLKGTREDGDAIDTGKIGTIVAKALLPADMVPDAFLLYEHDPYCRTQAELLSELERVYPGFSSDNLVTVLLFRI